MTSREVKIVDGLKFALETDIYIKWKIFPIICRDYGLMRMTVWRDGSVAC